LAAELDEYTPATEPSTGGAQLLGRRPARRSVRWAS